MGRQIWKTETANSPTHYVQITVFPDHLDYMGEEVIQINRNPHHQGETPCHRSLKPKYCTKQNNNNNNNNNVLSLSLHYKSQLKDRQTDIDRQTARLFPLHPPHSMDCLGFSLCRSQLTLPGHWLYHHVDLLWHIHSLFKSELSSVCHLVLPFSVHSIFSFPWGHPVSAYVFFLIFTSYVSLLQWSALENSSYARCDQSS
jgi:hypothetical protein